MADESVKAAFDFAFRSTENFSNISISLRIEGPILAGIIGVGALSLGAFYLANRLSSERAIREALEARNEAGVVDPKSGILNRVQFLWTCIVIQRRASWSLWRTLEKKK